MMTEKLIPLRACAVIHWVLLMAVLMSFNVLCTAEEQETMPVYTIVELKGDVRAKVAPSDSFSTISKNMGLKTDLELMMAKGSSLKIRVTEGDEVVLEGPMSGTLERLLILQKAREILVKKTLDKIPEASGSEKKVEISTQSTSMTRGAKPQAKPMPYIWKVNKRAKTSSTDNKESKEKK